MTHSKKELENISKDLLDSCMTAAINAACEAGNYSTEFFGKPKTINKKGRADLVTEVDVKCESIIRESLESKFKDFGFYGEESYQTANVEPDYRWIVDPIDGTSNFAHGYPHYCVAIGLAYKGTPVLGVVYAPLSKNIYSAHIFSPAYKNESVISVSKTRDLIDSMLITGFYYQASVDDKFLRARMLEFENVTRHTQALRRDGAAALDICFIADGVCDGFYEYGLSAWDVCASSVILERAGGVVSGVDGKPYDIYSKIQYIGTNGLIHQGLLDILSN